MPYKDPIKEKERSLKRRKYFREYRRIHPQLYIYKESNFEPSLGRLGEKIAFNTLEGSVKIIHPADLLWKGKLVEVKTARKILVDTQLNGIRKKCKTYRWKFCLSQLRKVDLFFIICKDLDDRVQYVFLIPDGDLKVRNLSITENNILKYSKYLLSL